METTFLEINPHSYVQDARLPTVSLQREQCVICSGMMCLMYLQMEFYNAVNAKAFPLIVQGILSVLVEEIVVFQYDDETYDSDRIQCDRLLPFHMY